MKSKGFTLIELLIVVAIIGILAAIAIPNFLQAQVRAKVASTQAEMRTAGSALELYRVDNNVLPPMGESPVWSWTCSGDLYQFSARVPNMLSTPIQYVTSIDHDTFKDVSEFSGFPELEKRYVYFNFNQFIEACNFSIQSRRRVAGSWMLYSWGPDQINFTTGHPTYLNYDPTNGTISFGNIIRTEKVADGYAGPP